MNYLNRVTRQSENSENQIKVARTGLTAKCRGLTLNFQQFRVRFLLTITLIKSLNLFQSVS